MKIIHVIEPFAAGLVTFLQDIVADTKNNEFIIIHGERKNVMKADDVKKVLPDNIKYIRWTNAIRNISLKQDIKAGIELYKILKPYKNCDIVHLHSSKAGFIGRIVCFLLGIKNVVYTPNGVSFINKDISKIKSLTYLLLELFGYLFAGKVISTSISEYEALKKNKIKSKTIFNGTNISDKPFKRYEHKKFRIVTSGRIAKQKAPNLFNIIAKHFENDDNYEFIWVGDGIQNELLNSKNITKTGWLNKSEVEKYLQSADLYISTARWEGLPFSVLEAMNVGLPLLLSKCIGNKDLVVEGINGLFYDTYNEAIENIKLLKDHKEIANLMGINSHKICSDNYCNKHANAIYQNLYVSIILHQDIVLGYDKPNCNIRQVIYT